MRRLIISLILLPSLASLAALGADPALTDNPPDRHIVVPGDTLWGIASKYLKDPWKWPELWGMNRDQVKNPHRIFPGDVIVLEKNGGQARLRVARETVRLSPQIRVQDLGRGAIPAIPADAIEPFLSQPLVIEANGLETAPMLVGAYEHRVVLGRGDTAFVKGMSRDKGQAWQIYRSGRPLVDPETSETLGHEALYLGEAQVVSFDEISTVQITKAVQEVARGDRFVPSPGATFASYAPHAPEKAIKGRVMSSYGGVAEMGSNSILSINRGKRDGLEPGHVLAIYRAGDTAYVSRKESGERLPDERYGLAFVFRTFDRVSYALVLQSSRQVNVLDVVQNP